MIPMVDLKGQYESLQGEIDAAVLAALAETRFILGPNVQAFEDEAADYLGVKHAISCASGTDALHLALLGAGIQPGDEVITSPFTFIATAEAIRYCGAVPVFVDIDEATFNIDPRAVEAAITPRTRAVLPVHLFGQPANLPALVNICEHHDLKLIEDCAQSFGAAIDGPMTGGIGLAGAHSFFPSKNLGCYGDGGMVTTNDDALAEEIKVLRNHGSRVRYHHDVIGYNSRLDELQAVVLRIKLKRIEQYNQQRRRVAHAYSHRLQDAVTVPYEDGIGTHVYHQYTVLSNRRDAIMTHLAGQDIASAIYYPIPLHRQTAFADSCADLSLPIAERIAERCLSLPIFPELDEQRIAHICEAVKEAALA